MSRRPAQSARKGRVPSLKRRGSLRDVGFYLLIAVILLMTIFALRGGRTPASGHLRPDPPPAGAAAGVQRGAGGQPVTLTLKEPEDGQATVTYDVGDPDWFLEDFNDLIVEQSQPGSSSTTTTPGLGAPLLGVLPALDRHHGGVRPAVVLHVPAAGRAAAGAAAGRIAPPASAGPAPAPSPTSRRRSPSTTWPAPRRRRRSSRRLWSSSGTPSATWTWGPASPRACCWWARRAPARPCWPRRWPGRRGSTSCPSPAPTLWSSTWAWAPAGSGTSSTRPRRTPRPSCSSTRSTPWAGSGAPAWAAATTSGSRPSTSCWWRWTASAPTRGWWSWRPPTGRTSWTPPCCAPAGSTGRSMWATRTSRAGRPS